MIDTHTHIFEQCFDNDINEVVERAQQKGITHVIMPNVDSTTLSAMRNTATLFPNFCSLAIGVHPTSINGDNSDKELNIVRQELDQHHNDYVAIGEIGLDFYWDTTYKTQQIKAFEEQLKLATLYDKPVIIHARKSYAEVIHSLSKINGTKGVMHCFGGGIEEAKKSIELGFLLGIGGVLTYKNSHLDEIVKAVGLENLILETDAPYLAPVPYRGKRNEPSYVYHVAEKLADIFQCSISEVDNITTTNAKQLFNIK